MKRLNKLIKSISQTDKARLYREFIETYATDQAAEQYQSARMIPAEREDLLRRILAAVNLDAIRKSAEKAGRASSEAKAAAARANGAKGGRPRKNKPQAQETQARAISAEPVTVRDVECPNCWAKIGSPCKRPSGHVVFDGGFHADRIKAFTAAVRVRSFAEV